MKAKQKAQEVKPKIILDGKQVPEKEYVGQCEGIQGAVVLSEKEIFAFSSAKRFEKWIASSRLADKYRQEKKRMDQARDLISKIGEDKAQILFDQLQRSLDEVSQHMNRLSEAVSESGKKLLREEDLAKIYKTLLSPKVGTVWFYKDPDYRNWFHQWQGLFKISSAYVGNADNDTLSSLRVIGSNITLFEHSWWRGRFLVFGGYFQIRSFENDWYGWFSWFNDMMSSYWFWG